MLAALKGVAPKDYRQSLEALTDEGWEITKTGGNHLRISHPEAAAPVFAPCTSSDWRGFMNTVAQCRRALRGDAIVSGSDTAAQQTLPPKDEMPISRGGKTRKARSLKLAERLALEALMTTTCNKGQIRMADEVKKDIPMNTQIDALPTVQVTPAVTSVAALAVAQQARPEKTRPVLIDTSKPEVAKGAVTEVPDTAKPAAPRKRAGKKASTSASERRVNANADTTGLGYVNVDQAALDLALRITRGEVTGLTITQDMVGATLWHGGDISLSRPAAIAPAASSASATAAPAMKAIKSRTRGVGALDPQVLKVLSDLSPDWLSPPQIAGILTAEDPTRDAKFWNGSIYKSLNRLIANGSIEIHSDPETSRKLYRKSV